MDNGRASWARDDTQPRFRVLLTAFDNHALPPVRRRAIRSVSSSVVTASRRSSSVALASS